MLHSVLFLALSAVIGKSFNQKERIVGGKDAIYAPWLVALVYANGGSVYDDHFCSGSIINESWVITAGHCTADKDRSDFYIMAGIIDLLKTKKGQSRKVKQIFRHPHFKMKTLSNDISLVKLQSPLELNNDVAVIDLANKGNSLDDGQKYTIEGWGSIDYYWEWYPSVLQVLEGVPHYRIKKCMRNMPYISRSRHICAGGKPGHDACTGDSGGSLWRMVDSTPLLYGITSWGLKCATKYPGVYTKVSFFRPWIERKMRYKLSNPL